MLPGVGLQGFSPEQYLSVLCFVDLFQHSKRLGLQAKLLFQLPRVLLLASFFLYELPFP